MRSILLIAVVALASGWSEPSHAASAGNAERGAYILRLAGCVTCHTAPKGGAHLAGGRELKTPFGSFFTPNITPDPETGIGNWSDEDFVRALRKGKSPSGKPYYPAFPYTSYTRMTQQDIIDLKAHLDSVASVRNPVPDHDLGFPFSVRAVMYVWRGLFLDTEPFVPDPSQSEIWNRGAYIVNGPGHCGECHTPRNFMGAVKSSRPLSGNPKGPDNESVPNITGHSRLGIDEWSEDDLVTFLQSGFTPDGDFASGGMADEIEDVTSKLTDADVAAIAVYLKSLPAIPAE